MVDIRLPQASHRNRCCQHAYFQSNHVQTVTSLKLGACTAAAAHAAAPNLQQLSCLLTLQELGAVTIRVSIVCEWNTVLCPQQAEVQAAIRPAEPGQPGDPAAGPGAGGRRRQVRRPPHLRDRRLPVRRRGPGHQGAQDRGACQRTKHRVPRFVAVAIIHDVLRSCIIAGLQTHVNLPAPW